jgi:hypothetical protein
MTGRDGICIFLFVVNIPVPNFSISSDVDCFLLLNCVVSGGLLYLLAVSL